MIDTPPLPPAIPAATGHALAPPPDAAPSRSRGGWIMFAAGVVVMMIVLNSGLRLPAVSGDGVASTLVMAGLLLLSLWLHIVLHEGGHAIAGVARRMRVWAIGIGPWRLEHSPAGWRWRHGGHVRGIGGFVMLLPRAGEAASRLDSIVHVLGGPLANLVAALAAALAASALDGGNAAAVLNVFAVAGVMLGVVNLLPFHVAGWRTDGLNLLDLVRGAPAATAYLRMSQLVAASHAGVRSRDWPDAWMPEGELGHSPMLALNADLLRLGRAIDREDVDAARAYATRLVAASATAPPAMRAYIALGMASHAALIERDPELLEAWLARSEGGLTDLGAHRHWLRAEYAALVHAHPQACFHAAAARDALARLDDRSAVRFIGERLDLIEGGARG